MVTMINTLRPRQNGRRFADDTFKSIFLNEDDRISITISLKFVPKGPINSIPALVQIMAWRRSGDKPLSEPMMVSLLTHICVTRPQWDKLHYNPIVGNGVMGVPHIISYLGMKLWDLHVCDRASTITHVDRVKKSNPWYNKIWLCLNVTIWSSQICFSVIFIHIVIISKYLGKNCTYSHFFQ